MIGSDGPERRLWLVGYGKRRFDPARIVPRRIAPIGNDLSLEPVASRRDIE